jgi:hypothetical protein
MMLLILVSFCDPLTRRVVVHLRIASRRYLLFIV